MKREIQCSHDKPVSQCPECWPTFCYETGYTVEQRALKWLLGGDTGTSSKTLCAHMLNMTTDWASPPSDAADRGRCIRLLRWIPEWVPRLNELVAAEPGRPASVNGETDHKYGWREQVPLIISEGGF